jgi:glycosyltransferase involved in cell wall biosynthesis
MTTLLASQDPSTNRSDDPTILPLFNRRVLHVVNGEHYSGAERVQDLLATALPAEGFDVGFACLKPGLFPKARKSVDSPLHALPMRHRLDVRAAWRMAQIIRRENYELVHAHTPRSVMVGRVAAALAKVPLVYHVHSPTSRDSTKPIRNWLNHWSERVSLSGASALIPVSHSLARHMEQSGYDARIIHAVPNGVPVPSSKRTAMQPGNTWTLGMVALFRPRKGLEVLLDALAIVGQHLHGVRLRAVGPFETPQYEQQIKQRVQQLGLEHVIEWTGFTRDVQGELCGLDALILPSLFGEGLPMVVLEAMATGVPVIASEVEGVPEVIEHGVNGLLSRPADASDLARCIQQLVEKDVDWLQIRNHALRTHAEHFSDQIMAARVADIYRQIIG